MSDYDLSLTGAQIDAALSKVHNADATPTNGSQNMITSDAVHDSISGFLTSSDLATDFTSPDNATAPSTQAVQNLVNTANTADVTTITRTSQYFTSSQSPTDLPGTSISGSRITKDGNNLYTIDPGAYAVFVRYQAYGPALNRKASFRITSDSSNVHGINFTINGGNHSAYAQEKYFANALYESSNTNTFNIYFWETADYYDGSAYIRNLSIAFYRLG